MPADRDDMTQERTSWHALSGDEALDTLDSGKDGLKANEAKHRLDQYGPNRLREGRGRPWWRRLLDQFNNVLIIILLIAGVATVFLGQWVDAGAIFAVVLVNAAIGFFQEGKAERALESIKGMLSPKANVIRDGRRREVDAKALVPGDVVSLAAGDRVPADLRLLDVKRLRTQEAALTGEPEAVGKQTDPVEEDTELAERASMAFAGTMTVEGSATAVVVETGPRTEIGRISEMLEEVEQVQTPLLRQLDRFAKVLAGIIVAVATAMALYGVLVHDRSWSEMFLAAVGLAVAAIPQGLPALVTITLALGVQRMAKRNAIIRRLPAVETLGSVSTIYSDKTGTLTRNEMTLQAAALGDGEVQVAGVGFTPEGDFRTGASEDEEGERLDPDEHPLLKRFLTAGVLCNDASLEKQDDQWTINGDPTEGAFVVAGTKAGWDTRQMRDQTKRLDAIPFAPEHKYMATLDQGPEDDEPVIHVKGAPEVVLGRCDKLATAEGDGELDRDAWEDTIQDLSSRGYRVLAVADKSGAGGSELKDEDVESGLVLLGLAGLLDPPRDAAIEAVERCRSAGIRYLFNARLLTERSLSVKGLFGSRAALIAAGLVIVFQLLWTYTGPMQYLFGSAPLAFWHWGIIIAVAVAIFLLVEAEKAIWRRLGKREWAMREV